MKPKAITSSIRFIALGFIFIALAILWWIFALPQQAQDQEPILKGHGFITALQQGVTIIITLITAGLLCNGSPGIGKTSVRF
ncbi:hypothetical protein EGM51_09885 [Verrucomicrobia bacterium S94]|nr:hypothetical protein EGM51_09885 [Verrucomicrobia bacterium S94]